MAQQIQIAPPSTAAAVADGGATETVVLAITAIQTNTANDNVSIDGMLEITTAASGTAAVVVKCHRTAAKTGTQVGTTFSITATTATKYAIPFMFTDNPGNVEGLQYCITVTETSGGANGTVDYVVAQTTVITPGD